MLTLPNQFAKRYHALTEAHANDMREFCKRHRHLPKDEYDEASRQLGWKHQNELEKLNGELWLALQETGMATEEVDRKVGIVNQIFLRVMANIYNITDEDIQEFRRQ